MYEIADEFIEDIKETDFCIRKRMNDKRSNSAPAGNSVLHLFCEVIIEVIFNLLTYIREKLFLIVCNFFVCENNKKQTYQTLRDSSHKGNKYFTFFTIFLIII